MARIAGVDLPPQKRLWVGLTSIYGIGQERAKKLAAKAGVDHTKKIRDLTEDEVNHLRQEIEKEGRVEGDLRKEIQMNIRRLIEIQAYRGIRHRRNLPVRGHERANAERSAARRSGGEEEGHRQEGLALWILLVVVQHAAPLPGREFGMVRT
jgi:small subunit ribosomal protein S13